MSSSRAKIEHVLTFGFPIVLAAIGSVLVFLRGYANPFLIFFGLFVIFQCVGIFLIWRSKLSAIRRGEYFKFGTNGMSKKERNLYFAGYSILVPVTILEIFFAFKLNIF